MVSSQQTHAIKPLDTAALLTQFGGVFTSSETAAMARAIAFAEPLYAKQIELTGEKVLHHALGAATILQGLNMDADTLIAAILHRVPSCLADWRERVEAQFGSHVCLLLQGLARMEQLAAFNATGTPMADAAQLENLRKMVLAMVEDIRVVLIKLALRTDTLRHLSGAAAVQQQRIAHETHSIFAPLANRLGVWQIKWELEDLAVRYLQPEAYQKVARLLAEKRGEREQYIADFIATLQRKLHEAHIVAAVTGRPKHIYSILNKMQRKGLAFEQLFDVRAVRILVESVSDCYAALGAVQALWTPIAGEFDDYIARPKSNNYRSIHTAVLGARGLPIEVQIRTHEMHQTSELGVAAHWRYKEGKQADSQFDEQIVWLRQILEWKSELVTQPDSQFKNASFGEQIYVFTPQGKVIDLPANATPVDFAYRLHTDLGHRTRGAKINGNIAPLNTKLHNGQRVEILTIKHGAPSRDWLNPQLGFLQSTGARAKVRAWFNAQTISDSIAQGRALLDKELQHWGVTELNQDKLAQQLGYNKLEDLLAALGRSTLSTRAVARALQSVFPHKIIIAAPLAKVSRPREKSAHISVGGVNNLLTKNALCCKPTTHDPIAAYITGNHGITIHKASCAYLVRLAATRPERVLTAQWAASTQAKK
ncbi:MAG: bifunctional (p)ppGpp synthetase/guanosine-3',5'-bis(diphosphate) 3'-pyrophosphohydrolase [Sideroxydans sp.]|nr:bifunctional (p)ppGpp synthetase/guanosine-3',5'-bis(diphosphate) 3'-pyrophosphohydrolase [Sideroxydans sp.]